MKVWVLTSSRADYGIYFPLLKRMKDDTFFDIKIIAFGTHLSQKFGYSLNGIISDGFEVYKHIEGLLKGDSRHDIALEMGHYTIQFAKLWDEFDGDIALVLGDRYEMFAAVTSSIPFQIPIAHIHGGETTLGAIDNIFRHTITMASKIHFTANSVFSERVTELVGQSKNIYTVGSLSLENMENITLYTKEEIFNLYKIDTTKPTILFTFHPETINDEKNEYFVEEIIGALEYLIGYFQIVITLPNADTQNIIVRDALQKFGVENIDNVVLIENFGSKGYFSCMKYASFVLGNSSSGIIESASLHKYNINLGDRQKGRLASKNTIHCAIDKKSIISTVKRVNKLGKYNDGNVYYQKDPSKKIIQILKNYMDGQQ